MTTREDRVRRLAQDIDTARELIGHLSVEVARGAQDIVDCEAAVRGAERKLAEAKERAATPRSMLFVQKEKLARLFEQCFDEEHAR